MRIQRRNEREDFVRVIIRAIMDLSKVKITNNHYYLQACRAGMWGIKPIERPVTGWLFPSSAGKYGRCRSIGLRCLASTL